MKAHKTKASKYHGTHFDELNKKARADFKKITSRTKRKPYVRSAYFKKQKVFLKLFWEHLQQKNWKERARRLKYFACAIDLIKNTRFEPTSKQNPNKSNEILHRFAGLTKDDEIFYVQIKEDKKNDMKWFMSVFPEKD